MSTGKQVNPDKPGGPIDDWDDWPNLGDEASSGPRELRLPSHARFESLSHFLIAAATSSPTWDKEVAGHARAAEMLPELPPPGEPTAAERRRWRPTVEDAVGVALIFVLLLVAYEPQRAVYTHRFPPARRMTGPWPPYLVGNFERTYTRGGSADLQILPDSRYSLLVDSHVGMGPPESGYASADGERLFLLTKDSEERRADRTYRVVNWGPREYLVRDDQLERFCKDVLDGYEPRRSRAGHFLLRRDDWDKEVSGLPDLPSPWVEYLRERLLQGRVTLVVRHVVNIDLGSDDGVRVGALLAVRGRDPEDRSRLRVLSVSPHSCTAVELDAREDGPPLGVGRRVVAARDVSGED